MKDSIEQEALTESPPKLSVDMPTVSASLLDTDFSLSPEEAAALSSPEHKEASLKAAAPYIRAMKEEEEKRQKREQTNKKTRKI